MITQPFFPASSRARIAYLHDVMMALISFPLSLFLRIGEPTAHMTQAYLWEGTAAFAFVCVIMFPRGRLYKGIWRYASIDDLLAITKTVTLAILVFLPLLFLWTNMELVPRSLPLIHWFVLVALLGGPRFVYRIVKDRRLDHILERSGHRRVPILLVGAGSEADLFIREQKRNSNAPYKILGMLSSKAHRVGRELQGVPVLGEIKDAREIIEQLSSEAPERLVLTNERSDGAVVRELFTLAQEKGFSLARLPKLSDLRSATGQSDTVIRPIAVEDLLGRPQATLDRPAINKMVAGKAVLITGAGGSIGSELVRQLSALNPSRIALLDSSEYQLYLIDQELSEKWPDLPRKAILGDVRDRVRIADVLADFTPDLVFHAAALKHVPMMEANPMEAILTNVVGGRVVADACLAAGVKCMVQISTDKAVNPTNVMGATKRLAESYIQAMDINSRKSGGPAYVAVRFGNVLGSTGSVVPLFQRQLQAGGPLSVTHPDITRYFMTIREAVELVLQTATLGISDASTGGRIFVLDMGEPVKIVDLARQMIRLAGLRPDKDIEIKFTGLRPGEKLYEELLHDGETEEATAIKGIRLAAPRTKELKKLQAALDLLEENAISRTRNITLEHLKKLVPEYVPDQNV